jgi:hypothetical protein
MYNVHIYDNFLNIIHHMINNILLITSALVDSHPINATKSDVINNIGFG